MDKSKRSQFCVKFPLEVKCFLPKRERQVSPVPVDTKTIQAALAVPQQKLRGPKDFSLSYNPFSFNSQAGAKHLLKGTRGGGKEKKRSRGEIGKNKQE